jgi:hypothetical protein
MPQLELRQVETRLLYLAVLYHLGRPGTEVDRVTRQPHDQGLTPVAADLERQLPLASGGLGVSPEQVRLLGEGLLGLVNELKQIALSGRSVTPGLVEAITRLYPDITPEEPAGALDLAGEATLLRRRMDAAIHQATAAAEPPEEATPPAAPEPASRAGWRFWRR